MTLGPAAGFELVLSAVVGPAPPPGPAFVGAVAVVPVLLPPFWPILSSPAVIVMTAAVEVPVKVEVVEVVMEVEDPLPKKTLAASVSTQDSTPAVLMQVASTFSTLYGEGLHVSRIHLSRALYKGCSQGLGRFRGPA